MRPSSEQLEERRLRANVLSARKRSVSGITSCDNAFVTTRVGPIGSSDVPRKLCSVRKRSDSNKCFICAKAKRQRQKRPVGTEITPSFCRRILLHLIWHFNLSDLIVFQQHKKSNKLNLGFIGLSIYFIVNVSSGLKSFKR